MSEKGDLMLDVDQAGELKRAFRRTRGSNGARWTNALIKKLSEGRTLGLVLDVLEGRAEIQPIKLATEGMDDVIIQVDRSNPSVLPDLDSKFYFPGLEKTGPSEYRISEVKKWFFPIQRGGEGGGYSIFNFLTKKGRMKNQLSLDDLYAIKSKGVAVFRQHFGKRLLAWKSMVKGSLGGFAPFLAEEDGDLIIGWCRVRL